MSSSDEEPINRDGMKTMLMNYVLQRKQAQQNARRTMWGADGRSLVHNLFKLQMKPTTTLKFSKHKLDKCHLLLAELPERVEAKQHTYTTAIR